MVSFRKSALVYKEWMNICTLFLYDICFFLLRLIVIMISLILSPQCVKYDRYLIQRQIWFFSINYKINVRHTHTNFVKINVPNLACRNNLSFICCTICYVYL